MNTTPWQRGRRQRGFALPELVAVILVCMLTLVLAVAAARRSRLAGWDVVDAENLHRFATATTAYAADSDDFFWTFSWEKGMDPGWGDGGPFKSDMAAAAGQAITILRTKGHRGDMTSISNWFPHVMYSQLTLYDYLGEQFPPLWGVSPADSWRLKWAEDPLEFDQGVFMPNQPPPGASAKRWPYSSSYQLPPAFYDRGEVGERVTQSTSHSTYFGASSADFGAFRLADVAFPSQKVHLHDEHQRHFGERSPFFGLAEARVALLFVDGSADARFTDDANPGWSPNNPESLSPSYFSYYPDAWEPPTMSGLPFDAALGYYRWTREGLAGRDFGGPEVGPP